MFFVELFAGPGGCQVVGLVIVIGIVIVIVPSLQE